MKRLFISDLHLQTERPEITRALRYFLTHIAPGADELYLLGDVFEAWIGDDMANPIVKEVAPLFRSLADNGTHIFLMHGNRDFLMGSKIAHKLHATLLPELWTIEIPKRGKTLLMHGDELCIDDQAYQQFRNQVRDPVWKSDFLDKTLEERVAIAQHIRSESTKQNSTKTDAIMDVNLEFTEQTVRSHNARVLIHGHTHRPTLHTDINGADDLTRVVLGDWSSSGVYFISEKKLFALSKFEPPSTFT